MMLEAWYSPDAIKFTRRQVIFLLSILPSIREGYWPPDPRRSDTGYCEVPVRQKQRFYKAYRENIISVAAELEMRLEKTGLDGLLAKAVYCWGDSYPSLAKHLGCPDDDVSRRVEDALRYICGIKRKRYPYRHYIMTQKLPILRGS